jgi:hypothetical protein
MRIFTDFHQRRVQDWPVPLQDINAELLKCGVCGSYLGLVAQVLAMYSFLPCFLSFPISKDEQHGAG